MYKTLKKIALIITLAVFIAIAITAQNKNDSDDYVGTGFYSGIELAHQNSGSKTDSNNGNTYILNSFSEDGESHHLTIHLDYSNSASRAESELEVAGGTWSLVVLRHNKYVGTFYGKITDGSVIFPELESETTVTNVKKSLVAKLKFIGILGSSKDKRGQINSGMLNLTTDMSTGQSSGMFVLTF